MRSAAAAAVNATRVRDREPGLDLDPDLDLDPGLLPGPGPGLEADLEVDLDPDLDPAADAVPWAEGSMYVVGLLVSPTCWAPGADVGATVGRRDGDVMSGSGSGRPCQAPSANQSAACWAAGRCSGSLASSPRR